MADEFFTRLAPLAAFYKDIGLPVYNDNGSTAGVNLLFAGTQAQVATNPADVAQWAAEAESIRALIGAAVSATVATVAPVSSPLINAVNKLVRPTDEDIASAFTVATPRGPRKMIKLRGMGLGGADVTISLEFGPAVRACVLAAKEEMGYRLVINNAFRSYDPNQANAAQGGTSNHRTGDAVDFDIANTGIRPIDWVHRNKRRFGLMNLLWKPGTAKTFQNEFNHFSVNGH